MCTEPSHRSDSTSTKAKFNFVPSHGSPIFMYADRSNRNGFPRFIVFRFLRTEASGVATCVVAYFVRREPPIFDTSFAPKILTLTKLLEQFLFEHFCDLGHPRPVVGRWPTIGWKIVVSILIFLGKISDFLND